MLDCSVLRAARHWNYYCFVVQPSWLFLYLNGEVEKMARIHTTYPQRNIETGSAKS